VSLPQLARTEPQAGVQKVKQCGGELSSTLTCENPTGRFTPRTRRLSGECRSEMNTNGDADSFRRRRGPASPDACRGCTESVPCLRRLDLEARGVEVVPVSHRRFHSAPNIEAVANQIRMRWPSRGPFPVSLGGLDQPGPTSARVRYSLDPELGVWRPPGGPGSGAAAVSSTVLTK